MKATINAKAIKKVVAKNRPHKIAVEIQDFINELTELYLMDNLTIEEEHAIAKRINALEQVQKLLKSVM